ncbi:MAG: hypothetical protein RL369_1027, partial [Pseudomonadota bacterium]
MPAKAGIQYETTFYFINLRPCASLGVWQRSRVTRPQPSVEPDPSSTHSMIPDKALPPASLRFPWRAGCDKQRCLSRT